MADVTMLALVVVCFAMAQAYAGICSRLLSSLTESEDADQ